MDKDFETFNLRDFVIIDGKKYRVQDVVENKDVPGDSTVFCIESDNPRIRMQKYSLSEFQKMAEDGRMEVIPSDESTEVSEDMDKEDVEILEKRQKVMQEALGLIYPNYDAFEHRRGKEVIQYICDKLCVSDSSARFLLNRYLKSGMNPTSLMDMRQGWNAKDKSANVVNGRMNKDGTHSKVTLNEETLNNFEMACRYFKENCGAGVNLSDAYNYLIDIYYTDEDTLEKLPDDECPSYRRFRSYVEKNLKGVSVRDFTKNEREKFKALPEEERKARSLPGLQSEDTETFEEDPEASVKTEEANIGSEEYPEETVQEESVKEESVKEESVKEESVKEESAKEESVKEEPVKEEPVKEESVKEEPVKEEPVKEEPVIEEPEAEKIVTEEPEAEEFVTEEPVHEKIVQEEQVYTETAAEQVETEETVPAEEENSLEDKNAEAVSEGSDISEQNINAGDRQDEEPVSFEFRNEPEKNDFTDESGDIDLDKETVETEENKTVLTDFSDTSENMEGQKENSSESEKKETSDDVQPTAEEKNTDGILNSEADNQFNDVDYIDLDSEVTEEEERFNAGDQAEENTEDAEKSKLEQEAEKRKEKKAEREKEIKKNKKLFIALGVLAAAFAVLLFLLLKKPSVSQQETTLLAETETTIEVSTDSESTAAATINTASAAEIETTSESTMGTSENESDVTLETSEVIAVETTESTSAEPEKESDTEIIAVSSEAAVETTAPKPSAVETAAPETSPVETAEPETSPVESRSESQTVVIETTAKSTVVETLPQETTPAETKPKETKSEETTASVTTPAETKPKETILAEAVEQGEPVQKSKAEVGDYYQITGNNVNIRSKQYRDTILDIAPRGTIIQVTGDSGDPDWIQITHKGQDAVVYSEYVSKNISTEAHGQYYRVTGNHVNVRDAADRSIIYTSLPKGVLIEETGAYYDRDWVRFRWNGKEVVISRQYTETVVDENAPVKLSGGVSSHTTGDYSKEDKGTGVYYRIIADDVNVRDAAYREVAIRSYPKGTVVEKTGDSGDPNWILCKIDHKDVVISANLVEKVETDELSGLYRVKNDNTLLYSDNSKTSVLTELPAGILIRGEKQGDNSLWIKTEWKGKTAYACMRDVEAVE